MKDWNGGKKSVFTTLGASNHTDKEREVNDYYATDPKAVDALVGAYELPRKIWECACGEGHLAKRLVELGYEVEATDLIDRGYGKGGVNFLCELDAHGCDCILTNPPYKYATEFILKALELLPIGGVCAMFVKTTFLEGKRRWKEIYSVTPPRYMFQFSERVLCAKNADFEGMIKGGGSACAFAWFVYEKGWKGDTVIRWI